MTPKPLQGFFSFLDTVDLVVQKVIIVFCGLMTCTVFLQVFARYILRNPPSWTEEVARYLMIYMAYIGASHALKNWDNIYVDIILLRLKPKIRKTVDIILRVIVLSMSITFFFLSCNIIPKTAFIRSMSAIPFPMFYAQFALILGTLLMSLQAIGVLLKTILTSAEALYKSESEEEGVQA